MSTDKGYKWNRSDSGLYAKMKFRAKEFKRPMTLTLAQFSKLRGLPCYYCGQKLPEVGYGIDRLNNDLGYTIKNSIPCCSFCNKAKSQHSSDKFLSHIEAIYNHSIKKV